MIRAIKSVSVQRGRDPRDFTLVAFGGSGPIHAAAHRPRARHPARARPAAARRVLGRRPAPGAARVPRQEDVPAADRASSWPDELADQLAGLEADARDGVGADASARQPVRGRGVGRDALRRPGLRAAGPLPPRGGAWPAWLDAARGRVRAPSTSGPTATAPTTRPRSSTSASSRARPSRRRSPTGRPREQPTRPTTPLTSAAFFGEQFGLLDTPVLRRGDLRPMPEAGPLRHRGPRRDDGRPARLHRPPRRRVEHRHRGGCR